MMRHNVNQLVLGMQKKTLSIQTLWADDFGYCAAMRFQLMIAAGLIRL
jgi:hypothetical protein